MTKKKLGRFMDMTTDFGFKTVFSEKNEELLLSFLNGIFEGRKVIVKINHLRLKQLGNSPEDRDAIFDLYCTDEDANHYIVEMQVAQQKLYGQMPVLCSDVHSGTSPQRQVGLRIEAVVRHFDSEFHLVG
ncbi:hypothetical protein AGMMS49525_16940 [Bacteroidia bacterium]|nr:hypothetical protein AGMMS49525_16940 [Bacteroidia bacterium]